MSGCCLLILSLIRMVISVSTGLGLLLVNSNAVLSDFLPSVVTSIFPAAPASIADFSHGSHTYAKREELSETKKIIFGCLIPVLVILSGIFAGLTLGYMSLDETQLNVLSISGTPEQKRYAEKIKPIRKNGHLLLVTLLLSNMIVNETLPVIADPVLGGGFQGVVVSTVLIVLFAEVIPQSICTRYGLWVGAKMAPVVHVLLWTMGIIAWPVAKLLEIVLGPHHGIIYRRTELKELIAMHSSTGQHGGDLNTDTITIIGATLDLQEKVVRQAMTPINDVFMLSIDSKLDYETLRKICATGHSRVPVYEEVEVPTSGVIEARNKAGSGIATLPSSDVKEGDEKTMKVKRIVGIFLVKQCVLLDPSDAIPLRQMTLNKVPFVPNNEPLLGVLDKFQEGRSHMAIVSRFGVDRAKSVKKAVKQSLTQRIRQTVGISDDSGSSSESESSEGEAGSSGTAAGELRLRKDTRSDGSMDRDATLRGKPVLENDEDGDQSGSETPEPDVTKRRFRLRRKKGGKGRHKTRREKKKEQGDIEKGEVLQDADKRGVGGFGLSSKEQITPADAVLAEESANEFLQILDPAIMPMGIITLEDVLEELIGEEIYDEFDPHHQGAQLSSFIPPDSDAGGTVTTVVSDHGRDHGTSLVHSAGHDTHTSALGPVNSSLGPGPAIIKPIALKAKGGFGGLTNRSRSAPPIPREQIGKRPSSQSGVSPKIGDRSNNEFAAVPTEMVDEKVDRPYPDPSVPHPTNLVPIVSSDSQPPEIPTHESTIPQAPTFGPHLAVPAPSRSVSPASLEAYFLERKRRGGGSTPRIVTPAPGVKGKGFKSSPLSPVERDADAVKKSKGMSDTTREGDGNIPPSETMMEDDGLS